MAYPVTKIILPKDLVGATNGRLTTQLVDVNFDGVGVAKTHSIMARVWAALYAACYEDTGVVLSIASRGDAYRSYDSQSYVFQQRYTTNYIQGSKSIKSWQGKKWYLKIGFSQVATPGMSNHGLGLALDIAVWNGAHILSLWGSHAWQWMLDNAAAFGLSWEAQSEPWHLHYFAGDNVPARVLAFEAGLPGPVPDPIPPTPTPPPPGDPVGNWPETPNKPILSRGAHSALVLYLQVVIYYKAGGNIAMDSDFGAQTESRVKDLQRFFGLESDGKVGKNTWALVDTLARQ